MGTDFGAVDVIGIVDVSFLVGLYAHSAYLALQCDASQSVYPWIDLVVCNLHHAFVVLLEQEVGIAVDIVNGVCSTSHCDTVCEEHPSSVLQSSYGSVVLFAKSQGICGDLT